MRLVIDLNRNSVGDRVRWKLLINCAGGLGLQASSVNIRALFVFLRLLIFLRKIYLSDQRELKILSAARICIVVKLARGH